MREPILSPVDYRAALAVARAHRSPAETRVDAIAAELRNVQHVAFPAHLFPPHDAHPFYEVATASNLLAGPTASTVVSEPVPRGMIAFVHFVFMETSDLAGGIVDEQIEYRLRYDATPVPPFAAVRGIVSPRNNPLKQLVVKPAQPGQTITVQARVLPLADGGVDGATADVTCGIAGWLVPIR